MLTRTSSIRWLSAVVLLLILVMGSGAIGSAQEEGSGTPSSTPAGDVGSRISIGDESVSGIGTEEAELPDATSTVTQDSAQSPENGATATETPIPDSGIGTNDDSGVSTGDGSPVPGGTPAETETPAPAETPDEPVQATSVGVSVTIYLCTADYAGGEIVLEDAEIGDANWFTADAMPPLPGKISIARRLIDDWLERVGGEATGNGQ